MFHGLHSFSIRYLHTTAALHSFAHSRFHLGIILTLLFCSFVYGFVNFLLLSELPSYFKKMVLGFEVAESGVLAVIPYTGLFLSVLYFGNSLDYLSKYSFLTSFHRISIFDFLKFVFQSMVGACHTTISHVHMLHHRIIISDHNRV